jgi:SNF2 family DNA or RNA helicase
LPAKIERILRVEKSAMQSLYYKLILERNIKQLTKSLKTDGRRTNLINILIELRKVCNHPYLIDGVEDMESDDYRNNMIRNSSKLMLLHKLLVRLKETGHRVLIFSQVCAFSFTIIFFLWYFG